MTPNYEVGRYYRVRCALIKRRECSDIEFWIPLIGPAHTDYEIAPMIAEHWHIDWRFMSRNALKRAGYDETWPRSHGHVIKTVAYTEVRRRLCVREMPPFPCVPGFAARVEKLCTGKRLNLDTMLCPHRGIPLAGMPVDDANCVICPGHGLKFRLDTGEIVPRGKEATCSTP